MNEEIDNPDLKETLGIVGSRDPTSGELFCQKRGRYVGRHDFRCQAPAEPCKFRSECLVYAIHEDAQRGLATAKNSIKPHRS